MTNPCFCALGGVEVEEMGRDAGVGRATGLVVIVIVL